jgi:hypothetical protein
LPNAFADDDDDDDGEEDGNEEEANEAGHGAQGEREGGGGLGSGPRHFLPAASFRRSGRSGPRSSGLAAAYADARRLSASSAAAMAARLWAPAAAAPPPAAAAAAVAPAARAVAVAEVPPVAPLRAAEGWRAPPKLSPFAAVPRSPLKPPPPL